MFDDKKEAAKVDIWSWAYPFGRVPTFNNKATSRPKPSENINFLTCSQEIIFRFLTTK